MSNIYAISKTGLGDIKICQPAVSGSTGDCVIFIDMCMMKKTQIKVISRKPEMKQLGGGRFSHILLI